MRLRRRSRTGTTPLTAPSTETEENENEMSTEDQTTVREAVAHANDRPAPMLLPEVREQLALLPFLDKQQATVVLNRLESIVRDAARSDRDVSITGFLKFETRIRPARTARNPHTGAPVQVPEKRVVKVRTLKRFTDAVAAD